MRARFAYGSQSNSRAAKYKIALIYFDRQLHGPTLVRLLS